MINCTGTTANTAQDNWNIETATVLNIRETRACCECICSAILLCELWYSRASGDICVPTDELHLQLKFSYELRAAP